MDSAVSVGNFWIDDLLTFTGIVVTPPGGRFVAQFRSNADSTLGMSVDLDIDNPTTCAWLQRIISGAQTLEPYAYCKFDWSLYEGRGVIVLTPWTVGADGAFTPNHKGCLSLATTVDPPKETVLT